MFAEDTAIVIISGYKDQNKIVKTNNGILNLFKYQPYEVQGHDVNLLMPPIIGGKHNQFLDQFFKTGRETVIKKEINTFAMHR